MTISLLVVIVLGTLIPAGAVVAARWDAMRDLEESDG